MKPGQQTDDTKPGQQTDDTKYKQNKFNKQVAD